MKINKDSLKKYKSMLALGMVMVTSVTFNGCTVSKSIIDTDSSVDVNANVDSTIIDNLLVAKTDKEILLLFCPKDRGLCINYETEEFMFMYRSGEDLLNKLNDYFYTNVEIENLKKYLIEKYEDKESYTYNEIFTVFNNLKNNSKILVKHN